jgi:hypothetical protein
MEVVDLKASKLYRLVKSLVYRRKMAETLQELEDEIRTSLSTQEEERVIPGFRISIRGGNQIEVIELPPFNHEQLELPLTLQLEQSEKGGDET